VAGNLALRLLPLRCLNRTHQASGGGRLVLVHHGVSVEDGADHELTPMIGFLRSAPQLQHLGPRREAGLGHQPRRLRFQRTGGWVTLGRRSDSSRSPGLGRTVNRASSSSRTVS
jgi:hypothetical protein